MLLNIVIAAVAQGLVPPPPPPSPQVWCDPFMIFFDKGSARVPAQPQPIIGNIISLKHQIKSHMDIVGHTDAPGSAAHNLRLSKRRADAVRAALIAAGVPSSQIRVVGLGENRLLIGSEKAERQNRRVEVCFF